MSKKNSYLNERDIQNVKDKLINEVVGAVATSLLPGLLEAKKQELVSKGKILSEHEERSDVSLPPSNRMEHLKEIISRICPGMTVQKKAELALAIYEDEIKLINAGARHQKG